MAEYKAGDIVKTSSNTPFVSTETAERKKEALKRHGILTKVIQLQDEDGFALKVVQVESDEQKGSRPQRDRVPITDRNVLTAPQRPGFHRHFVLDTDEFGPRIQRLERGGYEVVRTPTPIGDVRAGEVNQLGSPVMVPAGGGKNLYLMEIPIEWYEEAQARKQAKTDATVALMRRRGGTVQEALESADKEYGKISIGR